MINDMYITESVNDILSDLVAFVESADMDDPYEAEIVEHCEELFIEFAKKEKKPKPDPETYTGAKKLAYKTAQTVLPVGNNVQNWVNDHAVRMVIKPPKYKPSKGKIPNNADYEKYAKKVNIGKLALKGAEVAPIKTVMAGPVDWAFTGIMINSMKNSNDAADQAAFRYLKELNYQREKITGRVTKLLDKVKEGKVSKNAAEAEANAIKATCLKIVEKNKEMADKGIIKLNPKVEKKMAVAESCIEDPAVNLMADIFAFESIVSEAVEDCDDYSEY